MLYFFVQVYAGTNFIYFYLFYLKSTTEGADGKYTVAGTQKIQKYTQHGKVQHRQQTFSIGECSKNKCSSKIVTEYM